MSKEIWKKSLTEDGVLVSSLGRVLLPPRVAPLPNGGYRTYQTKPRFGQIAKSNKNAKHEYYIIAVYSKRENSRQKTRKVHQLVCEVFHGPKPFENAVVIHIDENALNNRYENLKWGTQKENLNSPKFIEYTKSRTGERNPHVKGIRRKEAEEFKID